MPDNLIGKRIKELRTRKGLTMEELGNAVGLQRAAINKYESGVVVNIKRATIEKLALVLDTTPAYLMGWPESESSPTIDVPQRTSLRSAARLQDANITAEEDQQISDYIEFLLSKRDKT